MPRLNIVPRSATVDPDGTASKKGKNLQIYFTVSESDPSIVNIAPKWKKDFFINGVLSCIDTVARLKKFLSENHIFAISEIYNDTVIFDDGTRSQGIFHTVITDAFVPQNAEKIFCAVSTVRKVFFGEHEVPVHALLYCDTIPQLGNGKSMDDGTRNSIKVLLDLFGNSAEMIGDILTSEHVTAASELERKIA